MVRTEDNSSAISASVESGISVVLQPIGDLGRDIGERLLLRAVPRRGWITCIRALTDRDVMALSSFRSLRVLDLSDSELTDKGLGFVSRLPKLRALYISDTDVTADGLKHLSGMNLEIIRICGGRCISYQNFQSSNT